MIRNYLKTAFRNLKRNKGYAIINVLGLTVGIAASLLIFLVIRYETSFDNFHNRKKSIYRVASEFHTQDGIEYSGGIAFPAADALRIDFPQIKEVAAIYRSGNDQVTIPGDGNEATRKFNEGSFYFAEPEFFKVFDFKWLAGTAPTTLKDPNSVVLTQEMAEKYFGDWKQAIGKTLIRNLNETYKITGILANPPSNTDFPLNIVASYSTLPGTVLKRNINYWVSTFSDAYTFVVLPENYKASQFNKDLVTFAQKHKKPEYAKDAYVSQPLSDIHFNDEFGNFRARTFSRSVLRALMLIGLFLLIIACVNFINLATAQAVNRSKEVGVRKVLGGNRRQLAIQFLSETAMITITALIAAVCIVTVVLPLLNKMLQVKMGFSIVSDPVLALFLIVVAVFVTFFSGLYPAIILSKFNPITALKSKLSNKMVGGLSLRRVLVVLQFAIAHVLIIGTLIVVSQMNFFRNASLGFDKASIINIDLPGDSISRTKMDYLRNKLAANPAITDLSFSFSSPSANGNWNSDFKFDNSTTNTNFSANLKWADPEYFKTYKLEFLAGRPYLPSDTVREFVVNETLLRKVGITDPAQAIGKKLNFWDGSKMAPIVGVVRDFNSYSLREPMAPVVLSTWKDVYQTINIKTKPGDQKATLAFVEKLWNETYPDNVFQYHYLDETISNFYRQEDRLSRLYKIFAGIAIFISCLGLYGLVSFMAVQRTKELGIRKVLGASPSNIVYLLSKEFSLLIVIAFVLAVPVAYYIMHQWLMNYSYRIKMGVTVFFLAILGSLCIAWITVGYRAIRAAVANPVKSLRTE